MNSNEKKSTQTKTSKVLEYTDLGFIHYNEAWDFQKQLMELRKEGEIPDQLLLLEHPHTYTLGKTADKANLIGNEEYLKKRNITVVDIDRGGDITYHGPGQIVGYPIIDLKDWEQDTHKYLRALEQTIINVCEQYKISATRNSEHTGVWIDDRKIAAIGIKISKWVTMHGFAFNINTDLSLFGGIIPCGIRNKDVTSMQEELKREISLVEVKEKLVEEFANIFYHKEIIHIPKEESVSRVTIREGQKNYA